MAPSIHNTEKLQNSLINKQAELTLKRIYQLARKIVSLPYDLPTPTA
jgi:hypothetical protein